VCSTVTTRPRTTAGRPHVPPAARRRAVAPQDRLGEIRAAALELFATIGYRATTMADLGEAVGMRAPSLYKHVGSKHELLDDIMTGMMEELLRRQRAALALGGDVGERLRRITAVHVQYHAEHRYEAFVGHREIDSLEAPQRARILELRREYETAFRRLVHEGVKLGTFTTSSDRWSSYAILDMGIGVSAWYNPAGPVSPSELAASYAELALRMLGSH
jgi:AcrR family transcriptional regulator